MRAIATLVVLGLVTLALPACRQTRADHHRERLRPGEAGYDVHRIGAQFDLQGRDAVVIRVDDEYRLILASEGEWGRGMFESGWSVVRAEMEWAEWLDVPQVAGLRIAFLSPEEIAVRFDAPESVGR